MTCDLCKDRPAKETILKQHVCRPCARTLKPARAKRYRVRQAEKVSAEKAEKKRVAKREKELAEQAAMEGVTEEA